jgi:serine protease Do
MLSAVWTTSEGQQLREAYRNVRQAVVIVRTQQKELAPFPQEGVVSSDGLGSGVLISNDGKVLTAAHLVQIADRTWVEFLDAELISAHVIASDINVDVALLQLDRAPKGIAPATLGDSDKVEVGDQIFVIGAPYGLGQTLTAGHVSGRHQLNRLSENSTPFEFLQSDAAINGGNSGSPVFSMEGKVVGIVSSIMSRSGGSEGLAFATASNTAERFLLERKPFWSGIEGLFVTGDLAKALNLPQTTGVLVQRIAEGSIAWRLGLRPGTLRANVEGAGLLLGGDIILGVNGVQITEHNGGPEPIYCSISALKPGDALIIKVFRQGQVVKLSIPIEP